MWRVFEFGFILAVLIVVTLFVAPLILKGWEAYCGWIFKDRK